MTDRFTWQGASHPLNALPVMHANDGRTFSLPEWGFRMITSGICDRTPDGYEPCIGDICVLAAGPESIHGHICVYTAEGWCSDWIYESGMNPYSGECQYKIYRWGK